MESKPNDTLIAAIRTKARIVRSKSLPFLIKALQKIAAKAMKNNVLITASKDLIGVIEKKALEVQITNVSKINRPTGVLARLKTFSITPLEESEKKRHMSEIKTIIPKATRPKTTEGMAAPKDKAKAFD